MKFNLARLAPSSVRSNWQKLIRAWEGHKPGWHELPWLAKQIPEVIAERERMIEAGELIPASPRLVADDPTPLAGVATT